MTIKIILHCPDCQSPKIKKNGKKSSQKQNYFCKECGRQFIGNHALTYKGWHSELIQKILVMLVRGFGIRDIAAVEKISVKKVLSTLVNSNHTLKPKQSHYDNLEVDEFWTFVGNKKNRQWLIYAYHRESGEIVAFVWGKRNLNTAKILRAKLLTLGVTFDTVYSDNWESFNGAFAEDNHIKAFNLAFFYINFGFV